MKFKIYYADGSVYQGDPYAAPALGVLVIVERDPDSGRRLVAEKDYFVWDGKNARWWAVDEMGMHDYLIQPGPRRVLFGRTVPNEEWYAVCRRANADPDFPARTSWGNKERVL